MASSLRKIEVERFNGTNFEMWKLKMEDLLIDRYLWDVVDANVQRPSYPIATTQYDVMDQKAKGLIRLFLADSVLINVHEENTAKKIWDKVDEIDAKEGIAQFEGSLTIHGRPKEKGKKNEKRDKSKSKGRSKSPRKSKVICWNCSKLGHICKDCKEEKKNKKKKIDSDFEFIKEDGDAFITSLVTHAGNDG
ncbi:hypothetical protein SUGI_0673520 [Cryptomeria japonica]|nr:hypothetical protein SUGI_0673520 [Cryptomeria japonica]